MDSSVILFEVLGILVIASALGVILFKNAIRSALSLVVNLFSVAMIYFTLRAQMLGIAQIMVYIGAIMVLFLFAVMLLNLGSLKHSSRSDYKGIVGSLFGVLFFGILFTQVILPMYGSDFNLFYPRTGDDFGTPQAVGKMLFSQCIWPFEVISVLLLVGVVGAILLAKRRF